MNLEPLSVSELVYDIKESLEGQYRLVACEGEISNLSSSGAGHWYFNLSDKDASISVALFKMDALRNPLIRKLKNGDKIIISGPISVYPKRGTFQLLAKKIVPAGLGNLHQKFEALKLKLQSQGFFDISLKKEIPALPKKIAIITAANSAALADITNVIKRRSLWCDVLVIPAVVQGDKSAKSILLALSHAQSIEGVDVIVLTRGGGSIEDLWSFNDEALAMEIINCSVPVISAVGHQTDFTICDYVSDLRVETPTAAGQVLTEEQSKLKSRLKFSQQSLKLISSKKLNFYKEKLNYIGQAQSLYRLNRKYESFNNRLQHIKHSLSAESELGISAKILRVEDLFSSGKTALLSKREGVDQRLHLCSKQLQALNPSQVLERGYTLLKDKEGKLITNLERMNKINSKQELELVFYDGSARVEKIL